MKGKAMIGFIDNNDEEPPFFHFDLNSDELPAKIAGRFQRDRPPTFLYDVTDNLDNRDPEILLSELSEGKKYLWVEHEDHWQDKKLVQNALFCSKAAYQKNPLEYLNNKRQYHGVILLIAANVKFGKQVASLFIASTDFPSKMEMLIVAFRGTSNKTDIESDLQIGMKTDDSFVGKVHGGFFDRAMSVPVGDILDLATLNKVDFVVSCGQSLGGAVSSLVHIKLQEELKARNLQDELESTRQLHDELKKLSLNNLINITFGAPMLGNKQFANYLVTNSSTKTLFNFVSVKDFIPPLLSIGFTKDCVREKSGLFLKVCLKLGLIYHLCVAGLKFQVQPEQLESAKEALRANKSTLLNDFEKSNYVPIGKYLLIKEIEDKVNIEDLNNHAKIVERVLQASIEFACENPSDIAGGHSLDSYFDLIKSAYGGFVTFKNSNRKILIEKKTIQRGFQG